MRAFFRQRLLHLAEGLADHGEALQRIGLELGQIGRCHCGAGFLFLFFRQFFFLFFCRFHGSVRQILGKLSIRVHQAVDQFVDAHFVALDLVRQRKNFGDRGRAGGNRLHHVLQAFLDALGDFDFAFAGQQLDRAHFAHVHAHRIGGAAEIGIHGGKRRLGLFHDILVGHCRRGIGHEQGFGIRRLVVDGNAHVVDHADDALDLLGIEHVVRQVVVDLGIGQVAAFLAQHDQGLQAHPPRIDVAHA